MKLFDAIVRLSGSIYNEVPKTSITAAEIEILRLIHGGDESVRAITLAGEDKSTSKEVRALLSEKYGPALTSIKKTFESIFGARTVPLPEEPYGYAATAEAAKPRKAKADNTQAPQTEVVTDITPGAVVTADLIAGQLAEEVFT